MPSAIDTTLPSARLSLSDLSDAYDNWRGTLEYSRGEFDEVEKITALYRFAIANYHDHRIDLLLDALGAMETAGKES